MIFNKDEIKPLTVLLSIMESDHRSILEDVNDNTMVNVSLDKTPEGPALVLRSTNNYRNRALVKRNVLSDSMLSVFLCNEDQLGSDNTPSAGACCYLYTSYDYETIAIILVRWLSKNVQPADPIIVEAVNANGIGSS